MNKKSLILLPLTLASLCSCNNWDCEWLNDAKEIVVYKDSANVFLYKDAPEDEPLSRIFYHKIDEDSISIRTIQYSTNNKPLWNCQTDYHNVDYFIYYK